jgi:hypothetical protein
LNLFELLDHHYKNKSHVTPVLLKPKEGIRKKGGLFSGDSNDEYVIYALEENTDRLIGTVLNFELEDGIPMKTSNLAKHPRAYF